MLNHFLQPTETKSSENYSLMSWKKIFSAKKNGVGREKRRQRRKQGNGVDYFGVISDPKSKLAARRAWTGPIFLSLEIPRVSDYEPEPKIKGFRA